MPGARRPAPLAASFTTVPFRHSRWPILALTVAGGLAGLIWAGVAWKTPAKRKAAGATTGVLVGLATITFTAGIAVPYMLAFLRGTIARYLTPATVAVTQGTAAHHSTAPLLLGVSALLGSIASVLGWLSSVIKPAQPAEKAITSWLKRFAQKHRGLVINAVAAVAGPMLTVALALLAINFGASHLPDPHGISWGNIVALGLPVLGLLGVYVLADLNSWSLHPYFRQHLCQTFALGRFVVSPETAGPGAGGVQPTDGPAPWSPTMMRTRDGQLHDAAERPYECPYQLSESLPAKDEPFPEVLICAAANVNDYGKVPTGVNAASFVFSNPTVGGPLVGECDITSYETATRAQKVTVPTAIAIAGAAISPEMGQLTRWPLRFLMTLANVRLGVWLPNPDAVSNQRDDRVERARKWVWDHLPGKDGQELPYRRPRPRYLFRELLGRNRLSSHFIYVTDGGYYDNLGLIELLRKRCDWIYCIDGSDGKEESFRAIGRAFALARAEGLADIDLDPRAQMGPRPDGAHVHGRPDQPFVQSTFAAGTVRYADTGATAPLIIVKAGVTEDAPWDIRSWQESHPQFPYDPALNQFFTAEQFDAYRALGEYAMTQAVAQHRPPGTTDADLDQQVRPPRAASSPAGQGGPAPLHPAASAPR